MFTNRQQRGYGSVEIVEFFQSRKLVSSGKYSMFDFFRYLFQKERYEEKNDLTVVLKS